MATLIDLEAVIRHFGPQAVSILLSPEWEGADNKAIQAVRDKSSPDRLQEVTSWLRYYAVFQGITRPERYALSGAFLRWADARDQQERLATVDAICQAHESLVAECIIAYGKNRDFTSLASKALWLRYPDDVPLFDSYARRALSVFSRLECGITPPNGGASDYRQFIHVWKALYDNDLYREAIAAIEMHNYPYPVRVFDVILWIVGSPGY